MVRRNTLPWRCAVKKLMKVLFWSVWAIWVRVMYAQCCVRAIMLELDQEEISGTVANTDLEIHYLRQSIKKRWDDPPTPVAGYLKSRADKRAKELSR
jgi:hypothetical protein